MNNYENIAGLAKASSAMVLAAVVAMVAGNVAADDWPQQSIKIVVPFSPGGGTDTTARLLADSVSERLGQPIVVENRPGGSTNIGQQYVAAAQPDGYTFLMVTPNLAVNPSLFDDAEIDPINDFDAVAGLVAIVDVLAAHPSVPVETVDELIALAEDRPGELNYSSAGPGSGSHLATVMMGIMADIDVQHIPYTGSGPAVSALLAGEVDFGMVTAGTALQHIESGDLRPLGVSSAERSSSLPDVPTISEAALPGFENRVWIGMVAPAGTPRPIIEEFSSALIDAIAVPEISERLEGLGYDQAILGPDEFEEFIIGEVAKWEQVLNDAREAGIPVMD
jgi:tripartite-type tricarboxylate transporter receptor subunit TctC